ncbi:MAG: thioredoxin family protein [DPANN group archaeon]|nr:thioredoxin family protein [DPANN group archaeon]
MVGKIAKRMFVAMIFTAFIFLLGFYASSVLVESKFESLQRAQDEIQIDTVSLEIESSLLAENPCNLAGLEELGARLGDLGPKLDYMEKQSRAKDFENLKKYYALLEIKHWLAIQKSNRECNSNYTPILYFYSNSECDGCRLQGPLILELKAKNPKTMVYSFDVNSGLPAIKILKGNYKITIVPTIIIGNKKYEGYMGSAELENATAYAKSG